MKNEYAVHEKSDFRAKSLVRKSDLLLPRFLYLLLSGTGIFVLNSDHLTLMSFVTSVPITALVQLTTVACCAELSMFLYML